MEEPQKPSPRVCQDIYKAGVKNNLRKDGFPMNRILKMQIDYMLKNITSDWDFVILISGSGGVRLGKSYLASQLGIYWTSEIKRLHGVTVPFNLKQNFVFDGSQLIAKGNALGTKHPMSCLIFDEAGSDLQSSKHAQKSTKDTLDYLRECGQYNNLTILVLPDFFDLPKGVALNRSISLINVFSVPNKETFMFQRGYFKFYNKKSKKLLYLKGKKELNYTAHPHNFFGTFPNHFCLDKDEYSKMKIDALRKREVTGIDKKLLQRNLTWMMMSKDYKISMTKIAERLTKLGCQTSKQVIALGVSSVFDKKIVISETPKNKQATEEIDEILLES